MGIRLDKIPLNKVQWCIVPETLQGSLLEEQNINKVRRIWAECFWTFYQCKPDIDAGLYADDIIRNAALAKSSIQLFILANMFAYEEEFRQKNRKAERIAHPVFHPGRLKSQRSVQLALLYKEVCIKKFGSFSSQGLCVLHQKKNNELASIMLQSEVCAASAYIRYKIFHGSPAEAYVYKTQELNLAPEWLALEKSYYDTILRHYLDGAKEESKALINHRFKVVRTLRAYKRNKNLQRAAWAARQRSMPEAVEKVCFNFGITPRDFLYAATPVTEPFNFWLSLALALRHYHCWKYAEGDCSIFSTVQHAT